MLNIKASVGSLGSGGGGGGGVGDAETLQEGEHDVDLSHRLGDSFVSHLKQTDTH